MFQKEVFYGIIILCICVFAFYFIRRRNRRNNAQPDKFDLIHFHDEKGTLRLSIKFSNLFYIESSVNNVIIYYENKGKIASFLLRKSMKSIETQYSDYPLARCHRTYIVNIDKVKVLRNDKEGVFLDLDYMGLPDLPVSKTYSEQVIKLLRH